MEESNRCSSGHIFVDMGRGGLHSNLTATGCKEQKMLSLQELVLISKSQADRRSRLSGRGDVGGAANRKQTWLAVVNLELILKLTAACAQVGMMAEMEAFSNQSCV